jgi:hypothetical protein
MDGEAFEDHHERRTIKLLLSLLSLSNARIFQASTYPVSSSIAPYLAYSLTPYTFQVTFLTYSITRQPPAALFISLELYDTLIPLHCDT